MSVLSYCFSSSFSLSRSSSSPFFLFSLSLSLSLVSRRPLSLSFLSLLSLPKKKKKLLLLLLLRLTFPGGTVRAQLVRQDRPPHPRQHGAARPVPCPVVKRESARQQLAGHHARGPEVGLGADPGAQHLGGHVPGRALEAQVLARLRVGGVEERGEAEVDRLERRARVVRQQHKVAGLDVPVQDARCVALRQRAQHGAHVRRRGPLRVVPRAQRVRELAAGAVLEDQVHGGGVLEGVLERGDVEAPAEAAEDVDLAAQGRRVGEALGLGRVGREELCFFVVV